MRRDNGLVLVNALVIVLAISSVAAGLLMLATKARVRMGNTIETNQLVLYLDGMQSLIPVLLEREWQQDGIDHLGEAWATQGYSVPIDRGTADATLTDQQGLLDVNRLVDPNDATKAEFARLFDLVDLPRDLLNAIVEFMSVGGPSKVTGYLDRPVPVLPPGGGVSLIEELRQVEGFDDAAYDHLAPFISALPKPAPLNVNTAPAEVLQAVLGLVRSKQVADLIRDRKSAPYKSADDFLARAKTLLGEGPLDTLPPERITARTSQFAAVLSARLNDRLLERKVLFFRSDQAGGKTVAWLSYAVTPPAGNR